MTMKVSSPDDGMTVAMATPSDDILDHELPLEAVEEGEVKLDCATPKVDILRTEMEKETPNPTPDVEEHTEQICEESNSKDESKLGMNGANGVRENRSAGADKSEIPPKETAFDWIILLCAFGSNVIFGIDFNCFSVFFPYLMEYFQASAAEIGWCLSIETFVASMLSIFSSYPTELYGCRLPGVIGSLVFCLGVAITSIAPNLMVFYLTYGIVAGYGASICSLTSSVIVQQRFHRNRTLTCGIAVLGYSFGGILGPLIANLLLQHFNWRGAYLILSAIFAHRIAFALLFITPKKYLVKRTKTDTNRSHHDTCRAVRRYLVKTFDFSVLRKQKLFSLYVCAISTQVIIMSGYIQHCVNRAVQLGIARDQAFWAASIIGIANTVTRITVSFVGNLSCVNRCLLYACGLYSSVVSILVVLLSQGLVGTMTSSALIGVMAGCTGTIQTVVTVDLAGVELLTRCLAITAFIVGFFRLTASPFLGWLFDVTQNYDIAFAMIGCCGFIGGTIMIIVYVLQRRQRARSSQNQSKVNNHHHQHQHPHHRHLKESALPLAVVTSSTHELSHC